MRKPAKKRKPVARRAPVRKKQPTKWTVPATFLPPPTMIQVIADAARDPAVDPAKLRDLLTLHRELERDQDRRSFSEHMAALQGEITQIAADASNPQTTSRYASYAALDAVLRPHYTRHGFSVSFDSEMGEGSVLIVTCIVSRGAWSERASVPIPFTTKGPKGGDVMSITHAAASGLSYGKRYSLAMSFNLAVARDDDGNRAGGKTLLPSQIAELEELALGYDTASLFAKMEIENWDELPRSDFQRVKTFIMSKRRKETAQ